MSEYNYVCVQRVYVEGVCVEDVYVYMCVFMCMFECVYG